MTDIETIAILAGLITPIYIALFEINRKMGQFERICKEVDAMKEHVYGRVYEHI